MARRGERRVSRVRGKSLLKGQLRRVLLFQARREGHAQFLLSPCLLSRTAMISQFFILSSKGDPLIYKDCILDPRDRGVGRGWVEVVPQSQPVLPAP